MLHDTKPGTIHRIHSKSEIDTTTDRYICLQSFFLLTRTAVIEKRTSRLKNSAQTNQHSSLNSSPVKENGKVSPQAGRNRANYQDKKGNGAEITSATASPYSLSRRTASKEEEASMPMEALLYQKSYSSSD